MYFQTCCNSKQMNIKAKYTEQITVELPAGMIKGGCNLLLLASFSRRSIRHVIVGYTENLLTWMSNVKPAPEQKMHLNLHLCQQMTQPHTHIWSNIWVSNSQLALAHVLRASVSNPNVLVAVNESKRCRCLQSQLPHMWFLQKLNHNKPAEYENTANASK